MLRKAESPARKMKVGAQKCVIQRVTNSAGSITSRGYEAASAKKVARMIQGHECHDESAQDVYGNDPSAMADEFGRGNRRDFNPL